MKKMVKKILNEERKIEYDEYVDYKQIRERITLYFNKNN